MNRRSIFKFLLVAPVAVVLPSITEAKSRSRELSDLAIRVSSILAEAHEDGDVNMIWLAQKVFWGMPGLEPGLASEFLKSATLYGLPYPRPRICNELEKV
jgi:hypothetical protein